MPTTMSTASVAITIAVYLAVIFTPGLLTGLAAGLRGWVLAGTAPLLTYAIAGLAGPWFGLIGVGFNVLTFALAVLLAIGIAFGVHLLSDRLRARRGAPQAGPRDTGPPLWAPLTHLPVLACLLIGAAVGAYTVLHGIGKLDAIAQDWDAVFHANGIRYLDETGDGSLTGMSGVNKYGDGTALFYPNAYHLVATVVYQLVGPLTVAPMPAILNANTVLLPGLLALSLVTVVREFRGRAVLAGSVALASVAPVTLLYASMSRGPLLPFLLGLALIPIGAVALHNFLLRKGLDTGLMFALCAIGLLTIHTSTLFSGILFALPMLLQRFIKHGTLGVKGRARMIGADLLGLAAVAVASVVIAAPQLFGALNRATGDYPVINWPSTMKPNTAVGGLLTFQHFNAKPQLWLAIALFLGLVFFGKLHGLRWIGGTALLTGAAYVAVAVTDTKVVLDLSQPWWNDPFRFFAMAALPLTFIAGHGLAESQAWLRDKAARIGPLLTRPRPRTATAAVLALLVLAGFTAGSGVLYAETNAHAIRGGYGTPEKTRVSPDEVTAMLELQKLAKPGEWAMNDRFDGTVWTYAITGVRTVAAHYDSALLASDTKVLTMRFNHFQTDPEVRAAAERLNVRWLIIGKTGFIRDFPRRQGLVGYEQLPFLTLVYDNPGAAIYRVNYAVAADPVRPQPHHPQ